MSLDKSITHGKERRSYRKGQEMSGYKIFAIIFLLIVLLNYLLQMTKCNDRIKRIMNGISLISIYAVAFCLSELS